MHYDKPGLHETVHFSQIDFGAGANVTRVLAVPKIHGVALRGRVVGARVHNVTENFVGSTSDAGVRVGDGTDDDKYFDSGLVLDENLDTGESMWLEDDGAQVDIEDGRDTVTVTFVGAAGTPTGIADVSLHMQWW